MPTKKKYDRYKKYRFKFFESIPYKLGSSDRHLLFTLDPASFDRGLWYTLSYEGPKGWKFLQYFILEEFYSKQLTEHQKRSLITYFFSDSFNEEIAPNETVAKFLSSVMKKI